MDIFNLYHLLMMLQSLFSYFGNDRAYVIVDKNLCLSFLIYVALFFVFDFDVTNPVLFLDLIYENASQTDLNLVGYIVQTVGDNRRSNQILTTFQKILIK